MPLLLTTQELIDEVRSKIDLVNQDGIDDQDDILPALNRAQDYASSIYARLYEDPLLTSTSVTLTSGTASYSIPEDAFEDRIEKVEVSQTGGTYVEIPRLSYRDVSRYETSPAVDLPYYYYVKGRSYVFVPAPTAQTARVWYLKEPGSLVQSQGQITTVNTGSGYLLLDAVGSNLSTTATSLNSYINVINGQTGEIRATHQIQAIDSANLKITVKPVPTRATVLGRTVVGTVSATSAQLDDYVCHVSGTCVPQFQKPTRNFLIEYATAEMKDKLERTGAPQAQMILQKFEKQVEHTWAGREASLRIKKTSKNWSSGFIRRRIPPVT